MLPLIVTVITGAVVIITAVWLHIRLTTGICRCTRDLKGKTVIVTGGNSGIGLETARDLARRNARVILACITRCQGEEGAENIVRSTGNTNVIVKQVDLSSFQSIREFAEDIVQTEERLDLLVNNAGVLGVPENQVGADGYELTMTINYFGPFLLTNLLLPLLKRSAPSRIVMVSSVTYGWVRIDFDNLNCEKGYTGKYNVYGASKLAVVLFTRELSERLAGTGVTINAVHPGIVLTDLTRKIWLTNIYRSFMKSAREGAQTSIHVAVAEELEGVSGKYFSDCKEKPLMEHALNKQDARRLWNYSENITGLTTCH